MLDYPNFTNTATTKKISVGNGIVTRQAAAKIIISVSP